MGILAKIGFNPLETSKINQNIYAIKSNAVNFFIYKDKEICIAIDTGIRSSKTVSELEKLYIHPDDVTHVFLTHTDYDHVGGIPLFKNAKVFISSLRV